MRHARFLVCVSALAAGLFALPAAASEKAAEVSPLRPAAARSGAARVIAPLKGKKAASGLPPRARLDASAGLFI